jgi:integrase
MYVLAIMAGLRQGELLGLKWEDIDLEGGKLQVRRTLYKGNFTTPIAVCNGIEPSLGRGSDGTVSYTTT